MLANLFQRQDNVACAQFILDMDSHHPCAAPDRRDAGPAGHAESMRDHAGKRGKPATLGNPDAGDAQRELRENVNTSKSNKFSARPRPGEAREASAQGKQLQQPSKESDKELAHHAALRRLNGSKSPKVSTPDSASTASSQPVLVCAYSGPSPSSTKNSEMRRKRQSVSNDTSADLPPLSSFSFQDILKEIDVEINPAVDAIAEIFGRSKLSLADEYSSHLPPQGELTFPASQGQNEVLEGIPNARLETVEEAPKGHSRRQSLALVGESAQQKGEASMATSAASVELMTAKGNPQETNPSTTDVKASLLPYVISWLKGSNGGPETRSRLSATDPGAAETLQRILGEI